MADSEVDTTQQVTSPTPLKNPKRVAAGKAVAEKTRQAREQQKKALAEAQVILANQKIKKKDEPPVAAPVPAPVAMDVLTTTQWLSVISIVVALGGIYYKREEIKARFSQEPPPPQAPPPSPVDAAPQPVVPKKRSGICHME